jgi:pimeloyl-ACP methyl ester carboxylesterase
VQGLVREQFGEFSIIRRASSGERQATVHFLHATGFNAESYRELYASLDPALDVYAMDARGHGFSKAPANPQKLRSWTPFRRDLEALAETLPAPLVLGGHSMGATVSMELAARRPDLVRGVVLVDPVIVPPKHVVTASVARFFGKSGRLIPISRLAAKRRMEFASKEAAVENFVGKGPFRTWPREWIKAYVDGGTVPCDGGVRLSCDRAWESRTFAVATTNPYRALRKVRCPLTLITRDSDGPPFSRASREAFMKCQPGTRLLVLEDATHFLAMEQPEIVREEIERMVATVA